MKSFIFSITHQSSLLVARWMLSDSWITFQSQLNLQVFWVLFCLLMDQNISLDSSFKIICTPLNYQIFKLVLEKAEEPEIKLPTFAGSSQKQENSRKTSISDLLTMPKPWTVWITINCGKFWKKWEYQTTWPASWGTYMQARKQQLDLDMEQQTSSK